MKKNWFAIGVVAVSALTAAGCSAKTEEPSLEGTWTYTNASGTAGVGFTFEDGKYTAQALVRTSDTSAQVMLETGTYSATGAAVTLTPVQSTCSDDKGEVYTYSYKMPSNATLNIVTPDGMLSLQRYEGDASSNFVVQFGCARNGKFTPSPLAPIAK